MGKSINVASFDEMKNAAMKLSELSTEYEDISNQLMNQAETMGAAWDGADNKAFVAQITEFKSKLQAMSDKLQTASEALKTQTENYIKLQDSNIAQVGRLAN